LPKKAVKQKTAVGAYLKCLMINSPIWIMEYTLASEMVFTKTSKDVGYSFRKSKYNIFVISS